MILWSLGHDWRWITYSDLKPVGKRLPVGMSLDDSFNATQDLLKAHLGP